MTTFWTWAAWIWANTAIVAAIAGAAFAFFYWPPALPKILQRIAFALLLAFAWGEVRYSDGVDSADSILRQAVTEANRRADAKDARTRAKDAEIEAAKREADMVAQEANRNAADALARAQEAERIAQQAQSDGRTDAEVIADLDARLEAAQGHVADLEAQLGDRPDVPDCKPKYVTRTIRRDCQAYVWPKGVTDALKERK